MEGTTSTRELLRSLRHQHQHDKLEQAKEEEEEEEEDEEEGNSNVTKMRQLNQQIIRNRIHMYTHTILFLDTEIVVNITLTL